MRRRNTCGAVAPSVVLTCVLAAGESLAAPAAPPAQAAPSELMFQAAGGPSGFVRPSVRAVRIEPQEAPAIDADLSDPVWAKAAVIENFTQTAAQSLRAGDRTHGGADPL